MPDIANVVGGTVIASEWGNSVADEVNILRKPSCLELVRFGSVQSIPNNTATALIYNGETEQDDELGALTPDLDTGEVEVNVTGWYNLGAGVEWDDATSIGDTRAIILQVDGVLVAAADGPSIVGSLSHNASISRLVRIVSGSVVRTIVRHQFGGALDVLASRGTYLTIELLRIG